MAAAAFCTPRLMALRASWSKTIVFAMGSPPRIDGDILA
jgi:hypothetical protein